MREMLMKIGGLLTIGMILGASQTVPGVPEWRAVFGYAPESVHRFEVRDFGYPFVPVVLRRDTLWLPFDTGNMVGLSVETNMFHSLGLPCSDQWGRLDSAGQLISSGCIAHGSEVKVFGVVHDSVSVYELSNEVLPGLVGPGMIPGDRFTMDYKARVMAADDRDTPEEIPGFAPIPLVQSSRHPRLILVRGRVQGHDVLIEIDTGKSRTTIDRKLVRTLGLEVGPNGIRVGRIDLGPRSWIVSRARIVDTSGISKVLPMPISLGIGSDILAGFVFTVDYGAGRLWVELPQ